MIRLSTEHYIYVNTWQAHERGAEDLAFSHSISSYPILFGKRMSVFISNEMVFPFIYRATGNQSPPEVCHKGRQQNILWNAMTETRPLSGFWNSNFPACTGSVTRCSDAVLKTWPTTVINSNAVFGVCQSQTNKWPLTFGRQLRENAEVLRGQRRRQQSLRRN